MSRAGDVVATVAKALADKPDAVNVTERPGRGLTVIELGRVIGRQGRTAQALRTLASCAADLDGEKVSVDFRD